MTATPAKIRNAAISFYQAEIKPTGEVDLVGPSMTLAGDMGFDNESGVLTVPVGGSATNHAEAIVKITFLRGETDSASMAAMHQIGGYYTATVANGAYIFTPIVDDREPEPEPDYSAMNVYQLLDEALSWGEHGIKCADGLYDAINAALASPEAKQSLGADSGS